MRMALIASSLRLAGAEKQFVYIARALHQAGIDVRIFYLGPGDHYQQVLNQLTIPVEQVFNDGRPLLMLARLIKALLRFKPDVALASQFGDLIFAGPAGRLAGALVLGGVRSDGFYELNTYARRSGLMLFLAHGLVANSFRAKENLTTQGVAPRKIKVLPNVIDLMDFDIQARRPLPSPGPPGRPVIAAVGSLLPCKRFERFLEALALTRQGEPSAFGLIVGKDLGVKAALEQKAALFGLLPDHLRFAGECHQVPALLRQCRALVLCSEYEGFPNVVLEAMAASLPVVTAPAGDAGRIVSHGKTGFVTDGAPESLAKHMVQLLRDPGLSTRFGEAGRARVEQEFSFDSLASRLLDLIGDFGREKRRNLPALRKAHFQAIPAN